MLINGPKDNLRDQVIGRKRKSVLKRNRELSNHEENFSKSKISKSNYEYIHFNFDEEEKPDLKKESNPQENASEIISSEVEINVKGE